MSSIQLSVYYRVIAPAVWLAHSLFHIHLSICICAVSSLVLIKIRLPGTFACRSLTSTFFFSKMFLTETDLANVALLFLFCIEDYFWQFLLLLIFYFLWCCYALLHLPEHCEWIFENPWKKTFSWKFKTEFKDLSRMKMRDKKNLFANILYFLKQISKYNAKHRR